MRLKHYLTFALLATMPTAMPMAAQESDSEQEGTMLYGRVVHADGWGYNFSQYGFYSFPAVENTTVTLEKKDNTLGENGFYGDGKFYFSEPLEFSGTLFAINFHCVDTSTFEIESTKVGDYYPDSEDMMTSACTYDPTTKTGYAVSVSATNTSIFNTVDLDDGTLTPILSGMTARLITLACNNAGMMYGVGDDGIFYSVDKATGALTSIGETGLDPEGSQSMAFSTLTGKLYWCAYFADETAGLYEINVSTGEASLLSPMPGNEQVVGLYVVDPEIELTAPDVVTDLKASFENGNLTGTISCATPQKTFDGNPLSGMLTIRVQIDQDEPEDFQCEAGKTFETTKTLTQGMHAISVSAGNSAGFSPSTAISVYVGNDSPGAVVNLTFSESDGTATVAWDAPTTTLHNGYLDTEGLHYTVVRHPGNVTVKTNFAETSFTETLPEEYANYYYEVTAFVDDLEGATAATNKIICGDAVSIPWTETFDTADSFDLFTSTTGTNEGNIWEWFESEQSARYYYSSYLQADAWLFTPPLKLDTEHAYKLTFKVKTADSFTENMKVTFGKTNTPEGQTETILDLHGYTSPDGEFETQTAIVKVEEAGNYYIAFYAYSEADSYYITIDDIEVTEDVSTEGPAKVSNLTAQADPSGELKADIAFDAPTTKYNGDPLTSLSEIKIFRGWDTEAIHVFENPTMGSHMEWTDENAAHGKNVYRIAGFNEAGEGESAIIETYVGEDVPLAVENLRLVGGATSATLYWEAPTKGQSGGFVDTGNLKYRILRYNNLNVAFEEIGTTSALSFTDESPELDADTQQTSVEYAVVPFSETMGSGPQTEGSVLVGEAYTLPFHESFAGAIASTDIWETKVITGEQSWALAVDSDTDIPAQDGDNGAAIFLNYEGFEADGLLQSPALSLTGCSDPALTFYVYDPGTTLPDNYYLETVASADGYDYEKVGERITIAKGEAAGWKKYIVSLTEYAGTEYFRFAFRGYSDYNEAVILVDNVTVESMAGGIEQMRQADAISAYPNPTSGMVYIESDGNADVEVYSIDGRSEGRYENANAINLTDKPAGIYLLKVSTETSSAVIRIVKR